MPLTTSSVPFTSARVTVAGTTPMRPCCGYSTPSSTVGGPKVSRPQVASSPPPKERSHCCPRLSVSAGATMPVGDIQATGTPR